MSDSQHKAIAQRPAGARRNPGSRAPGTASLGRHEIYLPLGLLALLLLGLIVTGLALQLWPQQREALLTLLLTLAAAGLLLVLRVAYCVRMRLLSPLSQLRDWAQRMRSGSLAARIPQPASGEFAGLARDINQLGESLQSLSREMDELVNRQTITLQRKTRSLEILYDVAARSNSARDTRELLNFYLDTLTEIVYAHAGTVRLLTDDDQMQLVGSVGLDAELGARINRVPLEHCLCAQDFSKNMILCRNGFNQCQSCVGELLIDGGKLENIAIPLRYKNRTLGIYNLFVEKLGLSEREDIQDILTNIGQHLSMAIEKAHWDEAASRLSIMEERAMLAYELHDSLAQTLASLRFRVSLLQQELGAGGTPSRNARNEVEQLKAGLDEANLELRELLSHFRIRMDERGLIPATENLIQRFRQECGIQVFFQNECSSLHMPPMLEVHILHILQEALANIRKHSDAKHVRIIMRCVPDELFHLLIEDDGMGIEPDIRSGRPGEHVGLTIMRERAQRIGARLTIESEPGEGTRVELDLRHGAGQSRTAAHA